MSNKDHVASFDSFEGVYCSGFFITDPSLLTAVCLLFDKVHILNHLEYVIDFSKKFHYKLPEKAKIPHIELIPMEPCEEEEKDPFSRLTPAQKRTANAYLWIAQSFLMKNSSLVGKVLHTSLLPHGEVFDVKLMKKGRPGQKNLYRVTLKDMEVKTGGVEELDELVSRGAVPILGQYHTGLSTRISERVKAKYLASVLAMKSVELILPETKQANDETILEARERLKDYLPPFWSSMLRLSGEFRARLEEGMAPADLEAECANIVDTTVRPALIDLSQKMLRERKNWFHRIISPAGRAMKVMAAKPPLTTADLISSGLAVGANVTLDIARQMREVGVTPQESGLALLLELSKIVRKRG